MAATSWSWWGIFPKVNASSGVVMNSQGLLYESLTEIGGKGGRVPHGSADLLGIRKDRETRACTMKWILWTGVE